MKWQLTTYRAPDPAGAGGGGGAGAPPDLSAIERLIARLGGGDSNAAITALLGENREYRERHRLDQEEKKAAEAKLPKDGDVVLKKDSEDLKLLAWAKEQKLTPEAQKKLVDENAELKKFKTDTEFEKLVGRAAQAMGYVEDVLVDLVKSKDLHIEFKDIVVEDKEAGTKETKSVPHVRPAKDEKAALKTLADYVESDLKPYRVALTTKPSEDDSQQQDDKVDTKLVMFPKQRGGGKAPSTDVAGDYLKGTYKSPFEQAKS